MKQCWRSLLLITLPLATLGSLAPFTTVRAQIAPDNTLGAENSVVTPNQVINGTPSDRLDGGATRGANLFHSFREFNINEGRGAYFSNPAVIENIFSRVTGGNPSNILGRLGVLGNANLFFINPNGIIFGPNARLDLNGSFLGSTAHSLIFDNGFRFSASNPQAPPLLTVNIPIGLRFRDNPSGITVRGLGQDLGLDGASTSFDIPTLQVPVGQNLTLVGGNVSLDGGVLQAPGGRVELGGLAAAGEVGLNNGSLSFPDSVARADVSLTNRAGINVITDAFGGGSIDINARNIGISGSSLLTAGIASDLGEIDTIAGDITLNATGETRIEQSRIENNVNSNAIGNSGNINITAGLLSVSDGSGLSTSTFGSGNAGGISVQVNGSAEFVDSTFFSNVEAGATGQAGDITINAGSLSLLNTAQLQSRVVGSSDDNPQGGQGNGGNVTLNVQGNVTIADRNQNGNYSGIFNDVEPEARGDAGNITINAGSILLDSRLLDSVFLADDPDLRTVELRTRNDGGGLAGDITLNARDQISIVGSKITSTSDNERTDSFSLIDIAAPQGSVILNNAEINNTNSGTGYAGDNRINARDQISITNSQIFAQGNQGRILIGDAQSFAPRLLSIDGAVTALRSNNSTAPDNDAGSIELTAGNVEINQAQLSSSTFGSGNAGGISVQVNGSAEFVDSTFFSNVEAGATGQAGDITINAGLLSLLNGAQLQSGVVGSLDDDPQGGQGNGGNVTITVQGNVRITDFSRTDQLPSAIFTNVEQGASGNAGNITITSQAGSVFLDNGAQLYSTNNGDALAESGVSGNAGNITITSQAGSVFLDNGELYSTNNGDGSAGFIQLNARDQVSLSNQSRIFSEGQEGLISIGISIPDDPSALLVPSSINIDNSTLSTTNSGTGRAGYIALNARDQVSLTNQSRLFSEGQRGLIFIGISLLDDPNVPSPIPSSVKIDNSSLSTTNFGTGRAGYIALNARDQVFLTNQSQITSDGREGGIFIGSSEIFTSSPKVVSLDASTLSTTNSSVTGNPNEAINAGDISIDASDRISLVNGSKINAFTQRLGNAGSVTLQAENGEISLADQSSILSTVEAGGIGNGGNINLSSRDLTLRRNSDIITNATASGTGGNITIDADFLIAYPDNKDGSDITADAANGPGGAIDITANRVFGIQVRDKRTDNNDITAISEFDPSLNGNIDLNTPDVDPSRGLVELPENVVDPAAQIAQNPCQQGVGSQFIVTGRGGLPPNPNQALSSDNVLVDLVEPVLGGSREQGAGSREQGAGSRKVGEQRSAGVSPAGAQERTTSTLSVPKPVVPAQGWVFNEKGEVVLTAYNPNNTGSQRPWQTPASCAAPNR